MALWIPGRPRDYLLGAVYGGGPSSSRGGPGGGHGGYGGGSDNGNGTGNGAGNTGGGYGSVGGNTGNGGVGKGGAGPGGSNSNNRNSTDPGDGTGAPAKPGPDSVRSIGPTGELGGYTTRDGTSLGTTVSRAPQGFTPAQREADYQAVKDVQNWGVNVASSRWNGETPSLGDYASDAFGINNPGGFMGSPVAGYAVPALAGVIGGPVTAAIASFGLAALNGVNPVTAGLRGIAGLTGIPGAKALAGKLGESAVGVSGPQVSSNFGWGAVADAAGLPGVTDGIAALGRAKDALGNAVRGDFSGLSGLGDGMGVGGIGREAATHGGTGNGLGGRGGNAGASDRPAPVAPTATLPAASPPPAAPSNAPPNWNETAFLAANPQVAEAVKKGTWTSGADFNTAWKAWTGEDYGIAPDNARERNAYAYEADFLATPFNSVMQYRGRFPEYTPARFAL